jgi:hypothetical protein
MIWMVVVNLLMHDGWSGVFSVVSAALALP